MGKKKQSSLFYKYIYINKLVFGGDNDISF
jgi:hypothetical protein